MTTNQHQLEAYKWAIQLQFDEEKHKQYAPFLMQPSRANLRNLCLERMKDNTNQEDLKTFHLFVGFEFSLSHLNAFKAQKDKFRPIETFFKRETDLSAIEAIDMAAILVDFQSRPFKKFVQHNANQPATAQSNTPTPKEEEQQNEDKKTNEGVTSAKKKTLVFEPSISLKKKVGYGVLGVVGLLGGGYTAKELLFPEKQCMKWVDNHYEVVDCINEQQGIGSYEIIKPYDDDEFNRKELTVCDTTEFFVNGNPKKPKVWYDKEKDGLHYFNKGGVNPETDDHLKPITPYMINKYVKPCD